MGVLVIAASLVGVPIVAGAETAASPDDRWEPVVDECVVAMNSTPVGPAEAGLGADPVGTMRRDVVVWMLPDSRCDVVDVYTNWTWDSFDTIRQGVPNGEGTNQYDRHGEVVSYRAPAVPLPVCGRVADLDPVDHKPYYFVKDSGPGRSVANGAFDVSLSSDCSTSSLLVEPQTGGPAFAPGGCFISVTSAYERSGSPTGTVTAVVRVAAAEACDASPVVTGATHDPSISTPGSEAYSQVVKCDGTPSQTITVSTTESSRKATGGTVKERFDFVVDGGCAPSIANRQSLVWSTGGRVDCRRTVSNLQTADSVDDIVCASDFGSADSDTLRLYRAFFAREPDVDGAKYWLSVTRDGATPDDLAYGFSASDEFLQVYGQLDDENFLILLYRNMLGRLPDPAGFEYWRDEMTVRGLPRHLVVRWVVANNEFISRFPYES